MRVFDLVFCYLRAPIIDRRNNDSELKRRLLGDSTKESVLIFLGWRNRIEYFNSLYSKFPECHKIIYQLPSTLLSGDLKLMEKSWERLLEKVDEDIEGYNITTVFGISLGTYPARYAAGKIENKVKLLLSLPGYRLSSVFWKSPATRAVRRDARKSKYDEKDFNRLFSEYDQIENLENLKGKEIRILIGKSDGIVPASEGEKLYDEMKELGLNAEIEKICYGHYIGGYLSTKNISNWMGIENKVRDLSDIVILGF